MSGILSKGYQNDLQQNDLFNVTDADSSEILAAQLAGLLIIILVDSAMFYLNTYIQY